MQKNKTFANNHNFDEFAIGKSVEQKSLLVEMQPFFVQKNDAEDHVYLTINDFKTKSTQVACDTNPVLVKFNIATAHLFFEFRENSYLDKDNAKFDYEGFLAVDLYSKNGQLCGVLAFGRQKGLFKSTQFSSYVVGTNGIAVFNKNSANAKVNYCTNRIDVALKIAQCGERVAYADDITLCVEFYLNTTNNTPIVLDKLSKNINAYSLFDFKCILQAENKLAIQIYLNQIHAEFIKQYGVVIEDPQLEKLPNREKTKLTTNAINIINMENIQVQPIHWLWEGWLPLGKMTILAGAGGCGKTNLSLALIATVTTGGVFPDGSRCKSIGKVLIYSTEDDPADTLKPRLLANSADVSKVSIIAGRTNQEGKVESFDPAKDFPKIEQYIRENPDIKLLMIDPIISAVSGDMNKANDVRRSLQPLVDLANEYNFSILGITHFAKGSVNNNPADRILGSQAFSALARMAWSAARREVEGDFILVRAKSNISTLNGGIRYQIEPVAILNEIETTKTTWLGVIDGSAKELLNNAELIGGDSGSVVDTAKEFLIELLNTVEKMSSKEVQAQAKEAGFSSASVRRAQESLNIKPFRPPGEKIWFWSLPKIHRLDEPSNF